MASPRLLLSVSPDTLESYEAAFHLAGAEVSGGYCPEVDLSCDGLVLCGGGDMDPALFGQENQGSDPPDPARDHSETQLFRAFYQAGKPIYIRVPVIAGLNDSEGEILKMRAILQELQNVAEVRLLPYHTFGREKYTMLGYGEPELFAAPEEQQMKQLQLLILER